MNFCELSIKISAFANVLAADIEDDDQLQLIASIISQLGDTIATIAAQRIICKKFSTQEKKE